MKGEWGVLYNCDVEGSMVHKWTSALIQVVYIFVLQNSSNLHWIWKYRLYFCGYPMGSFSSSEGKSQQDSLHKAKTYSPFLFLPVLQYKVLKCFNKFHRQWMISSAQKYENQRMILEVCCLGCTTTDTESNFAIRAQCIVPIYLSGDPCAQIQN